MSTTTERSCLSCGRNLRGRIDKKFCDDACRNNYNNSLKTVPNNLVRNINNALSKNRRILKESIPEGEEMQKLPRTRLDAAGFNFKYITHTYKNQKGNIYYFVYEYGYLPLDNDWFLIVHRPKDQ